MSGDLSELNSQNTNTAEINNNEENTVLEQPSNVENNTDTKEKTTENTAHSSEEHHHHHHHHSDSSSNGRHSTNKLFSKSEFFDWMEIIIAAMVAVVMIFTIAFRVATIDGSSMVDTLHHGERVLLSNVLYQPKYGDIVVISRNYICDTDRTDHESQPIIKRIIAVEGQKISIDFDEGKVFVDGELLDEPYIYEPTKNALDFPTDGTAVEVPAGCVFVMGDNRNNSLDSRSNSIGNLGNGMVDTRYIIGKAIVRLYPFSTLGGLQ